MSFGFQSVPLCYTFNFIRERYLPSLHNLLKVPSSYLKIPRPGRVGEAVGLLSLHFSGPGEDQKDELRDSKVDCHYPSQVP